MSSWSSPLPTWVKVNVDTGCSSLTNKTESGFITSDASGNILGSGFQFHTWVSTVVMVKAVVVLHGLQFSYDMGFRRVILESDSRTVIKKLQGTKEDYSTI